MALHRGGEYHRKRKLDLHPEAVIDSSHGDAEATDLLFAQAIRSCRWIRFCLIGVEGFLYLFLSGFFHFNLGKREKSESVE